MDFLEGHSHLWELPNVRFFLGGLFIPTSLAKRPNIWRLLVK